MRKEALNHFLIPKSETNKIIFSLCYMNISSCWNGYLLPYENK